MTHMCKRWQQPSSVFKEINSFSYAHVYKLPPWMNSLAKEHNSTSLCGNRRCPGLPRRRHAACFGSPIANGASPLSLGCSASGALDAGSRPGGYKQKGSALRRHSVSPVQLHGSVQPDERASAIKLKVVEEGWHWLWTTDSIAQFQCVCVWVGLHLSEATPFSASTGSCGGKFPAGSYLITPSWLR